MLPSFVMPEIVLGVAMFMVVSFVLKFIPLGTWARSWAGDYQLSYPVIIVRARMLSIGKEYEEAAMDLFASSAIAFADSLDFVTVRYLSCSASSEPLSVKIYNFHGSPTPAVNAAASSSWSRPQWRSSSGTSCTAHDKGPTDGGRLRVRERLIGPTRSRRPPGRSAWERRCPSRRAARRGAGGRRPDGPARRARPRRCSAPMPAGSGPARGARSPA